MSHVEIRPVTGFSVEPWLDELAQLRIEVFRDFPYLYNGNLDYERRYLDRYAQSDRSVFVLALEFNRLIGAATALPLLEADAEFQAPFRQLGAELGSVFYFGESVLLKPYRGEGIGHRFFDLREQYAADFGFLHTAFCAVTRPQDHPARPADYRPLDDFWRGRGYFPQNQLIAHFDWTDVGESSPSRKALQFWLHSL
ncbi:MAG: GNAT family N-acetyltransferase [Pseudomonadota bacterium]|nr:GNAT family N-acetyltransferase [Pseudomonadota bacterium]